MGVKDFLHRLTTPASVLDEEALREFCASRPGATPIAEVAPRAPVTVVGEIIGVRIVPQRDGSAWLEATVSDGSGALSVMWTGRRRIAGVKPGQRLVISGRGVQSPTGRLRFLNPDYELL